MNISKHCIYCDCDGQIESNCFNNMKALEAITKNHNIDLVTSSTTSSRQALSTYGYAPSTLGYALDASSSPSYKWITDYGSSYNMAKDKVMFSYLNHCKTKNIYVGDDKYLIIVVSGTIHLESS